VGALAIDKKMKAKSRSKKNIKKRREDVPGRPTKGNKWTRFAETETKR
jgi:hypothetical protein